ncbi:hypothetical protein F7P83_03185 [Brevibacterium luteolum]|nr:hypothetical protein [Brevibacterium luteolum]
MFGFIACWVIAGSFFTTALTKTPGHWVPWACAALTAGLTAVTLTRLRWTAALVLSGPAAVLLSWFALAPLFLNTLIRGDQVRAARPGQRGRTTGTRKRRPASELGAASHGQV